MGYPEEQVQTNLTSLMAWSRRAGQRSTAIHNEVRSSKLTSSGMEPIPAEESRVLQGCLGGCALAHQHLEGLTATLLFPTVDLGTKTKMFSVKKQSKITPLPPSVWAHSARGQVMLVMTPRKLPRTKVSRAAAWVPVMP